ncbi:hypothetical protein ACH4GP_16665 [Streptomyces celluloflavus]|uniref:DUF2267 domain-containing protein n=1 Tax=Streptomyces celluloflavus TaxID=58344 RepID=A0ABW7RD83_9ACTN
MPDPDLANAPDSHTSRTPDSGPWAGNDELGHRLRAAVQNLLDSLPLLMEDLELNFSDALVGGGEVVCDLSELHPSWAPLIEADALRLVADTAGLRTPSLFSLATPRMIAAVDAQPPEVQQALVERVAERFADHDEHVPNPRSLGAVSRSPLQTAPATPITPTSPPASTPRPGEDSHRRSR